MAIDGNKLQELIGKMMGDVGAAMGTALVLIGDKFGFYKTLAAAGPLTLGRTRVEDRHRRALCARMGSRSGRGGLHQLRRRSGRFSISPEQALVLADENGPAFFPAHVRDCRRVRPRRTQNRQCLSQRRRRRMA